MLKPSSSSSSRGSTKFIKVPLWEFAGLWFTKGLMFGADPLHTSVETAAFAD